MTGPRPDLAGIDADAIETALASPRWTLLARTQLDLPTIATWDQRLDRATRLLVPIDVQAYVVPATGAERTVAVRGDRTDPAPFAAAAPRARGVHLHWALPDPLLRGTPTAAGRDGRPEGVTFPTLPDRWVVLRLLRPVGARRLHVRGWVIDARTRVTVPLDRFAGTFPPPAEPAQALDRLDAAHGGSLLWTASYEASAGRFGFHDPLDDLPLPRAVARDGLAGDAATYVVAGWWSDTATDPLASGGRGLDALAGALLRLGWTVDDEAIRAAIEHRQQRDRTRATYGLESPSQQETIVVVDDDGRPLSSKLYGGRVAATVPVEADVVTVGPALPRHASLLHGMVLGVPVGGRALPAADARPDAASTEAATGLDIDDVVAALGAGALGVPAAVRDSAERLVAALTGDMLERLSAQDGLADLAEREHADGFASRPGAPLPGAQPDRLLATDASAGSPTRTGRRGRGDAATAARGEELETTFLWKFRGVHVKERGTGERRAARPAPRVDAAPTRAHREVVRAAPRLHFPAAPMLAVRGVTPATRHATPGGGLPCRQVDDCVREYDGLVRGSEILPSLGSGAIPEELLALAREAALMDPYTVAWLTAVASAGRDTERAIGTRLQGEMVRLYGTEGRYDGGSPIARRKGSGWAKVRTDDAVDTAEVAALLAEHSLLRGTPPHPRAVTTWRQPWIPLWLEWRVRLEGTTTLAGWRLAGLDLEPDGALPAPTETRTITGRSPLHDGAARALRSALSRWTEAEAERARAGAAPPSASDRAAIDRLGDLLRAAPDLVSLSLDGIREQLLGIAYRGEMPMATGGDGIARPAASALPLPLFGGTLTVEALRVVDAFGRTLDVPVARIATTRPLAVTGRPATMLLRPRVQHAARWVLRFVGPVDPASPDPRAHPDAFVDQVTPGRMVSPVAGWLLPDHIDESLELFDAAGAPIGELRHDAPIGALDDTALAGAVAWECAPGRPLPPDAGPLAGLTTRDAPMGELAAGVLAADVRARTRADRPPVSALTALLRAIDTTAWTVDAYAATGSATIAGLVGRPIAVVRATLALELPDDVAEVTPTHPGGATARRAAFAALARERVRVMLGALDRADDALLGYFVEDDFTRLHLVDKAVRALALETGRQRGLLGLHGAGDPLQVAGIPHDFVVDDDGLLVRPGDVVRLVLLMLPAGKVHVTSGLVPRKALALAEEWVGPALKAISPSVRVGPLLVDPTEIRLPLVRALGPRQRFTRRTGPLTWRDDPITAATQAAFLPRMPHEVQEGWIRVAPAEDAAPGGGGA